MAIKLGGGGGSSSQVNEIVYLNDSANTITLDDERVYLKGGVYETNISNYPDATAGYQANGVNFSVLGQSIIGPEAVAWDGTLFWVLNPGNNAIYSYTASGNYDGGVIGCHLSNTLGLLFHANEFVMIRGNQVVKMNAGGGHIANISISSQTSTAVDITTDGTNYYVLDSGRNVFKYNSSFAYQSTVATGVGDANFAVKALTFDGTYFWVMSTSNPVVKYNSSWVLQSGGFNMQNIGKDIMSKRDGTSALFVADYAGHRIKEYQQIIGVASAGSGGGAGLNYVRIK